MNSGIVDITSTGSPRPTFSMLAAMPFPALIDEVATLQTPWLGLFGDLDAGIPVEQVERLRDRKSVV